MAGADDEPGRGPWWVLAVAVTAAVTAIWVVGGTQPSSEEETVAAPMMEVAPGGEVALADLPEDHQALYRAATADPEAFSEVRCYCGCESFLGHEDLLACFVRADGAWEAHATGCAVCLAEAEEVAELREEGVPIDEIVRRIDERYGDITI
ncbi:MAG: PCYCGC motif-containing (lipo)protein [Nitriliruptoraceae bacterium]